VILDRLHIWSGGICTASAWVALISVCIDVVVKVAFVLLVLFFDI